MTVAMATQVVVCLSSAPLSSSPLLARAVYLSERARSGTEADEEVARPKAMCWVRIKLDFHTPKLLRWQTNDGLHHQRRVLGVYLGYKLETFDVLGFPRIARSTAFCKDLGTVKDDLALRSSILRGTQLMR
ncbi:hypothetical protein OPV22_021849 [Ensete ventricosum]|uniref:Secreted protein n=1 Tax=Ensete ventricosum TaxID=4639 RepID=A0AAV8QI33_ENSVE|nr:hypothetical protein OPV22_021849 [Ensete ventricosum]